MHCQCLLPLSAAFVVYGGGLRFTRGRGQRMIKVSLRRSMSFSQAVPPPAASHILLSSLTFFPVLSLSQKHAAIFKQAAWPFSPLPTALILSLPSQQSSPQDVCTCPLLLAHFSSHLSSLHQTSAPAIPPRCFYQGNQRPQSRWGC